MGPVAEKSRPPDVPGSASRRRPPPKPRKKRGCKPFRESPRCNDTPHGLGSILQHAPQRHEGPIPTEPSRSNIIHQPTNKELVETPTAAGCDAARCPAAALTCSFCSLDSQRARWGTSKASSPWQSSRSLGGPNGAMVRYHRPVGALRFYTTVNQGLAPWLLTIAPLLLFAGRVVCSRRSLRRRHRAGDVVERADGLHAAGVVRVEVGQVHDLEVAQRFGE